MRRIETDPDSLAEVFQLTDDPRPTDNIYGEQPYSDPAVTRIAVRHYAADGADGGLALVDLRDGSRHTVLDTMPRFPAFHAWGEHLYCQVEREGTLLLERWHYGTLARETVCALPAELGRFSYGTVSPDTRYYAVSVHPDDAPCRVLALDLATGERRVVACNEQQYFKHEQFSRDGANRVLIQANSADRSVVNLGVMQVDREGVDWLPLDAPPPSGYGRWPRGERYTPRCTGHETWVGTTSRVFASTGADEAAGTNIWTGAVGDEAPAVVCKTPTRFGHVSASRCGRFWIADAVAENGIPIYAGRFEGETCRRVVFSRTVHDGQQWSHTHPYLTADNRWLIFTSNRSGTAQVYGARIPDAFLAELG